MLRAIDGVFVETRADVVAVLHTGRPGTELNYALTRLGQDRLLEVTLRPVPTGSAAVYFVLFGIGVFTLLVGASVRLRRPGNKATLHFFWLSVASGSRSPAICSVTN